MSMDPVGIGTLDKTLHAKSSGSDHARGASAVVVRGVSHAFGPLSVLSKIDLAVKAGDFVSLLGPSGSGKTTLLRIIAGLIIPSQGQVLVDGVDITHYPIQTRDIGLVFQNYALFPHLTVEQNVAFGLKVRNTTRQEQHRRVTEMLEMVALEGLADRHPGELSGGQQQRVALARAMVYAPRVLLLDEPLGALDRRLRQSLGAQLRRVQRETKTTSIYVTHDQEEAFTLSDQVALFDGGVVHQSGPPRTLYESPSNLFVAQFVGDTNQFDGTMIQSYPEGGVVDIGGNTVTCSWGSGINDAAPARKVGEIVTCVVRPEKLFIQAGSDAPSLCQIGYAEVEDRIYMGSHFRLVARWRDLKLQINTSYEERVPEIGERIAVAARDRAIVALPKYT
jgi:ABC-type Fe3+/spermidine/putrescine transport system ATPase subunit